MKRGVKVIIFLGILTLLIVPLASAGVFSDIWGRVTGKATTGTSNLTVTIGNSPPTITNVEAIPAVTPEESTVNYTTFNFTATDTDGGGTINFSTAEARFQLAGETTRLNTSCINTTGHVGNNLNFTCTVGLYYFDANSASWTVNVTVDDNNAARGENSSTSVTFTQLTSMVLSPVSLNWSSFGVSDVNQEANNNPIVLNNTGNDIDLSINVTGLNLQGESVPSEFIFAANLTVNNVTADCPGGTQMVNATSTNVTSTILQRGNNSLNNQNATSGQEAQFYCVTAVNSGLSAQIYSSAAYGAWTIQIIT